MKKIKSKSKNKIDKNSLSFEEHLIEFKNRLIIVFITMALVFIACYVKSSDIISYLIQAGRGLGYKFIYVAPQEIVVEQIRIAGIASTIVGALLGMYEISMFCYPVFSDKRQMVKVLFVELISIVLMIIGISFCYKVLIPFILKYLKEVGDLSTIDANVSISNYISLVVNLSGIFGLLFEIPLVTTFLTYLKIVNVEMLMKSGKVVTVVILTIAAIITPPDVLSQCIVAIPLIGIYYLSTFVCYIIEKINNVKENKDKKRWECTK